MISLRRFKHTLSALLENAVIGTAHTTVFTREKHLTVSRHVTIIDIDACKQGRKHNAVYSTQTILPLTHLL